MPVTKIKSTWKQSGKIGDLVFANVASGTEVLGIYNSGAVNVASLKVSGTAITTTAAELNVLDGITATVAELNQVAASSYLVSAEVAGQYTHIVAPHAGALAKVYLVNHKAMSAGVSASFIVYSSAVSAGTITISGAASGVAASLTPTSKTVGAGGIVSVKVSATTQTSSLPVTVTALITR